MDGGYWVPEITKRSGILSCMAVKEKINMGKKVLAFVHWKPCVWYWRYTVDEFMRKAESATTW